MESLTELQEEVFIGAFLAVPLPSRIAIVSRRTDGSRGRRSTVILYTLDNSTTAFTCRFRDMPWPIRLSKMLWCSLRWEPVMATRALTFGKRVDFYGHPSQIAILENNGIIKCYDIRRPDAITILHKVYGRSKAHCICTMPNSLGSLAVGSNNGPIVLYRALVRDQRSPLRVKYLDNRHGRVIDCLAFHPDGSYLIAAGPTEAGFGVWDSAEGCCYSPRRITTGFNRVTSLAYSPCGRYIAAISDVRFLLVYQTENWRCLHVNAKTLDGSVVAFAWSAPDPGRCMLIVAFSDEPYLVLYEVAESDNRLQLHCMILNGTSDYLSIDTPLGRSSCVKDMCWDVYGCRLAVLINHPHHKAGTVALFTTHKTQEPEFIKYQPLVPDLCGTKYSGNLFTSALTDGSNDWRIWSNIACCYDKLQRAVRFVVYINGKTEQFISFIEQWEMADMKGPAYRLLK